MFPIEWGKAAPLIQRFGICIWLLFVNQWFDSPTAAPPLDWTHRWCYCQINLYIEIKRGRERHVKESTSHTVSYRLSCVRDCYQILTERASRAACFYGEIRNVPSASQEKNETEVKLVNEVCLFFLLEFAFTFSCLCWLYGKYITSLVYNLGYWVWMAGFGCLKKWIIWWCVCLVVVLMCVYVCILMCVSE